MNRFTAVAALFAGTLIAAPVLAQDYKATGEDGNEPRDSAAFAVAEEGTKEDLVAKKVLRRLGTHSIKPDDKDDPDDLTIAKKRNRLCAIAVLPGPAGNFNIRPTILNLRPREVDVVVMDAFSALGGDSLLFESVFAVTPPPGGTLDVEYPNGVAGVGPVVLSSTGWDFGETVSFNLDPDAYDNPAFGATVQDMDATRIEMVYRGRLRCAGTLTFNPGLNASIAVITQVNP